MDAATRQVLERIELKVDEALARLNAIRAAIGIEGPQLLDLVLTREQAAAQLKVSVRQLRRLVAAGRIAALPSGIARAELERYAKTSTLALPKAMTRPMAERTAQNEADRLTEMLKTRRKRR